MAVQTLFGQVQRFERAEFQRQLKRPRFFAPILHLTLFAVMIVAALKPDAFDVRGGLAGFAFWTLCLIDFPISIFGFGMMWSAGEAERSLAPALIIWAVLGTVWWFLLGLSTEAWMRRFRRKSVASE